MRAGTHALAGWRNSSVGTSFGLRDFAWVDERRYTCQGNVQYSSNKLNAPRELRQRIPCGFALSGSGSPASPAPVPYSVVVIHHGISKPFKAPAQKWWRLWSQCIIGFLWGATVPIKPSWLPVPSSGSVYDKETRKTPEDVEENEDKEVLQSLEYSRNHKRLIFSGPFHLF